jgi:hypothetical protein
MPRTRKRNPQKAPWTTENLEIAVKSVREDGRSVHGAAKRSAIPYNILQEKENKVKYLLLKQEENWYFRKKKV